MRQVLLVLIFAALALPASGQERTARPDCQAFEKRLRGLAAQEQSTRLALMRARSGRTALRRNDRLRRNMYQRSGCQYMSAAKRAKSRRCFDLRMQRNMARARVRTPAVSKTRLRARLGSIQRSRRTTLRRYQLSGCPQGRSANQ